MKGCALENGEIKKVDGGGGVLVCEVKVGVKHVETGEKGSEFVGGTWPNDENVIYVSSDY